MTCWRRVGWFTPSCFACYSQQICAATGRRLSLSGTSRQWSRLWRPSPGWRRRLRTSIRRKHIMANDASYSLPAEIDASIQAIRDDREHGASWLARAAAGVLLRLAEPRDDVSADMWDALMRTAAQKLVASRPSMAAVANTAARIWDAGHLAPPSESRRRRHDMAERLATQDEQTQHALRMFAENLFLGSVYTMSRS